MTARCIGCGDPCVGGTCEKCREWTRIWNAIQFGTLGASARMPVIQAPEDLTLLKLLRRIERLTRRVRYLERALGLPLDPLEA